MSAIFFFRFSKDTSVKKVFVVLFFFFFQLKGFTDESSKQETKGDLYRD